MAAQIQTRAAPRTARGSTAYFRHLLLFAGNLYLLLVLVYLVLRLAVGDAWWWVAFFNNFAPFYFVGVAVIALLALLLRSRLLLLRSLPFLLIGGAWFGPLFIPRSVVSADGPTLKVVTMNLFVGRADLEVVEAWLGAESPDIMALQEVVDLGGVYTIPDLGRDYSFYPGGRLIDGTWGIGTLTRLPLTEAEPTSVPLGMQALRTELEWQGQRIAFYSLHLNVPMGRRVIPLFGGRSVEFLGYDDRVRNVQINRLLAHLANEPLPYIVAGDFNMSDYAQPYYALAARMHDAFREAGWGLGTSWPVVQARGIRLPFIPPLVRLDYVWHSEHFRAVSAQQGPAVRSDHLPLVVTLTLR